MRKYYLIILVIVCVLTNAQNKKQDSIRRIVLQPTQDTFRLYNMYKLSFYYLNQSDFETADSLRNLISELGKLLGYKKAEAYSTIIQGRVAEGRGNYTAALDANLKVIHLSEKNGYSELLPASYNTLGVIYFTQKQYDKALESYLKAVELSESGKNTNLSIYYNNIGNIYYIKKQYDIAYSYHEKALRKREERGDSSGIANSYNNLGEILRIKGQNEKALNYFKKASVIQEAENNKYELTISHLNIGLVYSTENNLKEAKTHFFKAYEIATETGAPDLLRDVHQMMVDFYEKQNDSKNALFHYKNFIKLKDSLSNADIQREFTQKTLQFEFEQKELKTRLETEKKEVEFQQNSRRQKLAIAFITVILIVIIVFSFFLYNKYKETSKQKTIIEKQKLEVDDKNKEITDSINYASTIQEALLPARELKQKLFPKSFVLFMPKDIVSGDFYWYTEKNNRKLIAAVDCTGHGVPGSLMSMIGNNFLNELVEHEGLTNPADILNHLKFKIINALKQSETNRSRDGMDIALLSFNSSMTEVEFAAANNPVWLIRNNELIEFNGDKQPVGFFIKEHKDFTFQKQNLQPGDSIYIFTDGFADQFGGPNGKKFKYKALKELFIATGNLSPLEQEEKIKIEFEKWKGNLEQVDDVLIIGIRI